MLSTDLELMAFFLSKYGSDPPIPPAFMTIPLGWLVRLGQMTGYGMEFKGGRLKIPGYWGWRLILAVESLHKNQTVLFNSFY
jgi:hypothetical protein